MGIKKKIKFEKCRIKNLWVVKCLHYTSEIEIVKCKKTDSKKGGRKSGLWREKRMRSLEEKKEKSDGKKKNI